jgi:hemoglobin
MRPSLFERIGGENAVDEVVDTYYKKILGDPLMQPFFEKMDMQRLIRKQKSFLTFSFGGSSEYAYWEKGLRNAHANSIKIGLNDQIFDRAILHLVSALNEFFLSEKSVPKNPDEARGLVMEVVEVIESTRNYVLNK